MKEARLTGLEQVDPVVNKNLVLVMGEKEEDYIAALKATQQRLAQGRETEDMRSAFGVEHTISKGVPKGLAAVAAKDYGRVMKPNKKILYAQERMKAHKEGRFAASIARPPKQFQNQGLPQHHLLDSARSSGGRARAQSRLALGPRKA